MHVVMVAVRVCLGLCMKSIRAQKQLVQALNPAAPVTGDCCCADVCRLCAPAGLVFPPSLAKLTPAGCSSQAMHAEVIDQDEDVSRAQDKVADLHTEVRGVARQTYGYRRR